MPASSDQHESATLQVRVERDPSADVVVVSVAGEVDYDTAHTLRKALRAALDARPAAVILDLAGLRFLDSSGLGAIVAGWQQAGEAGVRYTLRSVPPVVIDELEITGLAQVLTLDDADSSAA
ncbi:STAS domain-containing protein [Dactylosporangium sp. CA-139066]|uniref:STAS domain-containing protein n=1 Tax=Dactylosporangium sp. CA-139066 TaxID=3239930 RepID=UPI003D903482